MRAHLAGMLLALAAFSCHRPLPQARPAPPLVAISARVLPERGEVRQMLATTGSGPAVQLTESGGEFHGLLPLEPGRHDVEVRALSPDGAQAGATRASIEVTRGNAARILVTVRTAASLPAAVVIESIAAPRSSVVAGDRMLLSATLALPAGSPVQVDWSTSPPGCGTFAERSAATTWWTGARAGPCTVTLSAAAGGTRDTRSLPVVVRSRGDLFRYPLRIASGRRHLVDQRGTPFLIKGESAWLALVNLDEEQQERYLADRAAKGFNLAEVMLVNHDYTAPPEPIPPANRQGEQPFLRRGELATPNEAYFDRAVAFVRRAASHGIVVLLAPLYLGFEGGREGWWQELLALANSRAVCFAYGEYVGRKFKDAANLIWLAGGDYAPPAGSEGEARYREIVRGIREAGASQLWTGHWNFDRAGGISTDEALLAGWMDLNGVYQYAAPYTYAARAHAVLPARPTFLLESAYEREHPKSSLQPFRKAWWWSMTSGGSGLIWGNAFLWLCEVGHGVHPAAYSNGDGTVSSWAAELESPGTFEALHLHAFFEGIAWDRLVPSGISSGGPEVVLGGRGSGEERIVAAATPENDLLVAYVPPDGTKPRGFTLDLSRMHAPLRARWYDPAAGTFPGPFSLAATRGVEVQTPGANASGLNDWVLLVDPAPANGEEKAK